MNSPYYTSYASGAPIYTSRTVKRVTVGRPESLMAYGDRISVRIAVDDRTVLQYETRQVADMTDLMGDVRRRTRGMKGLATVYIRNHDRGWARERRIKLYPQRTFPQRLQAVQVPMFFPWEL